MPGESARPLSPPPWRPAWSGRSRARAEDVKRWGGWILIGVGAWLLALAAFPDFFAGRFPV